MKKVLTILTIAFFATIGFTQTPDTARWVDGVWEVNKDPNTITTIDLTKGPNRVFNENTGDFYTLNPSDTTWSLLSRNEDLPKTYSIGDRIGDGYVFWIDTAFSTDGGITGTHGLVCQDPNDIDTSVWDFNNDNSALGPKLYDGIYSGEINTMLIANNASNLTSNVAVTAYKYSSNTSTEFARSLYGNWYVPNIKEFEAIVNAMDSALLFQGVDYSEINGGFAGTPSLYWLSQELIPSAPGFASASMPGTAVYASLELDDVPCPPDVDGICIEQVLTYNNDFKDTSKRVWLIRRF